MKKVISAVLAIMLIAVMSVGAFAFSGEYYSIEPPENYEENADNSASGVLDFVEGDEIVLLDGEEVYSGNNYNIYVLQSNVLGLKAKDLLGEDGTFEEEYKSQLESQYSTSGFSVKFDSFSASLEKAESFDYILVKSTQTLSDYIGQSLVMYQRQVMIPRGQYVVYITTTTYDAEESADVLTDLLVNSITINIEDSGLGLSGISAILIGGLVIFVLIIVAIVVAVVVSSKKKKKKQAALNAQYFGTPVQPGQPYVPQNGTTLPQQPIAPPAPQSEENTDNNGQNS